MRLVRLSNTPFGKLVRRLPLRSKYLRLERLSSMPDGKLVKALLPRLR